MKNFSFNLIQYWYERLRELRKNANLSQSQLAQELKIGKQQIAKMETGRNEPSIATLKVISEYFQINLNWFLFGKDPRSSKLSGGKDELVIYSTSLLEEELKIREQLKKMVMKSIKELLDSKNLISPCTSLKIAQERLKQQLLTLIPKDSPAWLIEDIMKEIHL